MTSSNAEVGEFGQTIGFDRVGQHEDGETVVELADDGNAIRTRHGCEVVAQNNQMVERRGLVQSVQERPAVADDVSGDFGKVEEGPRQTHCPGSVRGEQQLNHKATSRGSEKDDGFLVKLL